MSDVTTFDTSEPTEKVGAFKRLVNKVPLPVWFIVPVEAILLFLLITPSIMSIWLSLVSWQPTFGIGILSAKFLGLKNYIDLFTEPHVFETVAELRGTLEANLHVTSQLFEELGDVVAPFDPRS